MSSDSLLVWLKIDPVEFKKRRALKNELEHKIANKISETYVRNTRHRKKTVINYDAAISVGDSIGYTGLFGAIEMAREFKKMIDQDDKFTCKPSEFQVFSWANNIQKEVDTNGTFKCVMTQVQKYYDQKYGDIRIFVFAAKRRNNTLLYSGPMNPVYKHFLFIFCDKDGHFSIIKNLHRFFFSKQQYSYCYECNQAYKLSQEHNKNCPVRCGACFRMGNQKKCAMTNPIKCKKCLRTFMNDECYDYHISEELCQKHWLCPKCDTEVITDTLRKKTKNGHICGEEKCFMCFTYHLPIAPCTKRHNKLTLL